MSDTEDGSFDKEAEKAKLREQLEREEEQRRTTQHMSELLLKGATMTNKHCDACGDPLFRYEGREFCPTCAREGTPQGSTEGADVGEEPSTGAGITASGLGDGETKGAAGIDRVETGTSAVTPTSDASETPQPRQRDAAVPAGVASARAALVRKLTTLAQQAEATDDVGRSRELLAAAREAAEALAAIDDVSG